MSAIDRAVSHWRSSGVPLNPGAPPEQIARLLVLLQIESHTTVSHYFQLADGMADEYMDDHMLSFWSTKRILAGAVDGRYRAGAGYIDTPFADFLINSWFLCFRVWSPTRVGVFVEATGEELPSLEEFFLRYLTAPHTLGLMCGP